MDIEPIDELPPEPRRESFKESKMKGEPRSDVMVISASGLRLRERVRRVANDQGASLLFTYTQLDEDDQVVNGEDGLPLISPAHEVAIMGSSAGVLGTKGTAKVIRDGREVAVARAVDHFVGLAQLSGLMASRL